jgi:hypothetical protein
MSRLSSNLDTQRKAIGLTVREVTAELNRLGHEVAYSTVAGWFNGNRGIGKMEHLIAVCRVLKTDLDAMAGGDIAVAEDRLDVLLMREMRGLSDVQKEAIVALARSMQGTSKKTP